MEFRGLATRADRLLEWRTMVELQVRPCGPHVLAWWQWCLAVADEAHERFVKSDIETRESVRPSSPRTLRRRSHGADTTPVASHTAAVLDVSDVRAQPVGEMSTHLTM